MIGLDRLDARRRADLAHQIEFGPGVGTEAVDRAHHGHPEFGQVADMADKVRRARPHCVQVLCLQCLARDAPVHLERPHGSDQYGEGGAQPGLTAFDVEKLLGAQVGAEARFGHHVIA